MPTKDPVEGTIELEEDVAPTVAGQIRLVSGDILGYDQVGQFNLRGYDTDEHRAEDQLVHDIAENSYTEIERTGARVDAVRVYTSVAKTTKIREQEFTYTGNQPTTITSKQYDGAGVLAETYTETLAYTGPQVDDITGVLS